MVFLRAIFFGKRENLKDKNKYLKYLEKAQQSQLVDTPQSVKKATLLLKIYSLYFVFYFLNHLS